MNSLANPLLAKKRFDFISEAFEADKFAVFQMEGFESISRPFRFVLTLVSDDASVDFDMMLSHRASFAIYGPDGSIRTPYHGILAEFSQLHRADGYVFYRAVLVPRLWRLSLSRTSEIYLDERPISETVRAILETGRLTSADYDFRLTGAYRPRSFICQYQETYLDFVSRWLEKEGIYYYFDHSGGADRLIMIDDKIMHAGESLPATYRPDDALQTGLTADSVCDFVRLQKPLPHEVVLQDYNYRKAAVQLKSSAIVSESGIGEIMLYGENFRDQQEGDRYAKLRAQELICTANMYAGKGTVLGLRSGYFFNLTHHYRDDFNGRYLVTEVRHEGSQAGALLSAVSGPRSEDACGGEIVYRNSFRAIPGARQFRPERVTARPRMAGIMNATIDSEGSGEYADLDEHGQYKVQFPFDKTSKAPNKGSARVRMATPYMDAEHGMHFPLHKGAEVLLSFIDGDPDQPVIVGSLANSENPNVVTNLNADVYGIRTPGKISLHVGEHAKSPNGTGMELGPHGTTWKTAGSREVWTCGATNTYSLGPNVTLRAGPKVEIGASSGLEVELAEKVSYENEAEIRWKGGRVFECGGEELNLKSDYQMKGTNTVTISAGLNAAHRAAFDLAKKSVMKAAIISGLAHIGTAAASCTSVGVRDRQTGSTGKLAPDDKVGEAVPMPSTGLSIGAAFATKIALSKAAGAFATADTAGAYASQIKADERGIELTTKASAGQDKSRIDIQPPRVNVEAASAFTMRVTPPRDASAASTSASVAYTRQIRADAAGIALSVTDNAEQENTIDLQAPKVVVNAPSTLDMKSRDITCFAGDRFRAKGRAVHILGAGGEVQIVSTDGVGISADGQVRITGTDNVCVNGKAIRLG
ncbi:type VI secretion system tip protein VgrG [Paraburkholderia sp. UYCP14C]|uniref:type VI secretion system Vgr family protein n=1 Tax=Paraburkholderia sp. UYCP14C TaxID=2511130 RepID=UPI00101F0C61|nr:type VI secretion system tip protein TssI/VgrG [Paraburkholderia sp. UYCP14C]RZF24050.1 type VI secretion system tip protein VgrG [Paraburkholderia sp. UYCP14C]